MMGLKFNRRFTGQYHNGVFVPSLLYVKDVVVVKCGCEAFFFHHLTRPSIHPVIQGHPGPQVACHVYEAQQ